jgi:hypothetical protein
MSIDEKMTQLFHNLNSAYMEIAQFLTETKNRRDQLLVNGIPLTNPEVVMLSNMIESTVHELDDIADAIRRIRNQD